MKTYTGLRNKEDELENEVDVCTEYPFDTKPLFHFVSHSPTGFEWGYNGSGPADLALSILCDYFGERPTKKQIYEGNFKAWKYHQDFKNKFVANFDKFNWILTEREVKQFIEEWDLQHPKT